MRHSFRVFFGLACAAWTISGAGSGGPAERFSLREPGWVGAVAFSPDGRWLATGCSDGAARVRSAMTGKESATFQGHQDYVIAAAFSPDGQTLGTGSYDHTARLWDLKTKQSRVLTGHRGAVMSVSFCAGGDAVATGSIDGTIKVWDPRTGSLKATLRGHQSWVNAVAWAPDGKSLISGSSDGTLRTWRVPEFDARQTIPASDAEVRSLALSPDGNTLAAGLRYGQVRLWSAGKEKHAFQGHRADVWAVQFSPDGQVLVTGDGDWNQPGQVKVWRTDNAELLAVYPTSGEVLSVAISMDGRSMAAGGADRSVVVWNAPPSPAAPGKTSQLSLRETRLTIPQVDLEGALTQDEFGYPRLDASKLDWENPRIVERTHRAVVLENPYLRVTLLPEMGRVYSLVNRQTGHEQLWINPVAKPLAGQQNDTGWWMVWGGVEYTLPRGEHGTTWALPWTYRITEDSRKRKTVRMEVLEPKTRLKQELDISLFPDRAYYEANIRITNTGQETARFSHWVNPMWAPGGQGEVTAETEMIVPCSAMIVADRDFNRWMLGARVQDFEKNPLRWVKHWQNIGDLLAEKLTEGFYGAFSHEANEGIVRVFDPKATPGMDIWTWGFPPPPDRQHQYSLRPNLGYVEMWGGTAMNFSDEARRPLGPGRAMEWKEWMYAWHGTRGLTFANRHAAVRFQSTPDGQALELAVSVTAPSSRSSLTVRAGQRTLLDEAVNLSPERAFLRTIPIPASPERVHESAVFSLRQGGRTIVRTEAKPAPALQWGMPYLPHGKRGD